MANKSLREKREDEFIEYICNIIDYWKSIDINNDEKIEGVVHSVLTAIDGCTLALPIYRLLSDDGVDIAGCLHEKFGEAYKR